MTKDVVDDRSQSHIYCSHTCVSSIIKAQVTSKNIIIEDSLHPVTSLLQSRTLLEDDVSTTYTYQSTALSPLSFTIHHCLKQTVTWWLSASLTNQGRDRRHVAWARHKWLIWLKYIILAKPLINSGKWSLSKKCEALLYIESVEIDLSFFLHLS